MRSKRQFSYFWTLRGGLCPCRLLYPPVGEPTFIVQRIGHLQGRPSSGMRLRHHIVMARCSRWGGGAMTPLSWQCWRVCRWGSWLYCCVLRPELGPEERLLHLTISLHLTSLNFTSLHFISPHSHPFHLNLSSR